MTHAPTIALTGGEVATLLVINEVTAKGEETVHYLANALPDYDYITVCRFVTALENRGFVEGRREGRYKWVKLTRAGVVKARELRRRYRLTDIKDAPCQGCTCPNHQPPD